MVDTVGGALVGDIGQADVPRLLLAGDETLPCFTALLDDLLGVLFVLAFTTEGKLILWLAIWDLVDTEPLIGSSEKAR
jgi:hypothetical protein